RFFAGLTEEEAAEVLERSRRQVQHAWKLARAWLQREIERSNGSSESTS
ncbi:MAG: ECF-type sigma factor, partial [Planctomycetota bacterium JB042]